MTPREKANKLCMRFLIQTTTDIPYGINKVIAKECALIAVDEILDMEILKRGCKLFNRPRFFDQVEYWQEVKTEIQKL